MSSPTPGRDEIVLQTTENPDGEQVACFECETMFHPLEAFYGGGCPSCRASVERLFDQRSEAEKQTTAELIDEAEATDEVSA